MVILGIQQTSSGVYKITPDSGSAFFLRVEYLQNLTEDKLIPFGYGRLDIDISVDKPKEGDCGYLNEEESVDILNASEIYKVELAAMSYIARSEQCTYLLTQKLLKKDFDANYINIALQYLQSINYLNDERYASAWLRSRGINHYEGRSKLLSELMSRGIEKRIAQKALNDFFCDKNELELCTAAYKKCIRTVKDEKKVYSSLMRKGFTYAQIKQVIKQNINLF